MRARPRGHPVLCAGDDHLGGLDADLGQLGEQGLRAMGELHHVTGELGSRRGKLLRQPGAQALREEVADVALGGIRGPVHRSLEQRVERPGMPELADVPAELPRVRR